MLKKVDDLFGKQPYAPLSLPHSPGEGLYYSRTQLPTIPVSDQQPYVVEPAVTMGMKLDCQRLPLGAYSYISLQRNHCFNLNISKFSFCLLETNTRARRWLRVTTSWAMCCFFSQQGHSGPGGKDKTYGSVLRFAGCLVRWLKLAQDAQWEKRAAVKQAV